MFRSHFARMHKLVSRRPNARRLGPAAGRCPVPTRAAGPSLQMQDSRGSLEEDSAGYMLE